ncbi:hypothetical protein [Siminovitchia acidinfaciens]|nr:hypothetical protein [Siminovitchia acidinfaciens]
MNYWTLTFSIAAIVSGIYGIYSEGSKTKRKKKKDEQPDLTEPSNEAI